jgi:hypothetical protein
MVIISPNSFSGMFTIGMTIPMVTIPAGGLPPFNLKHNVSLWFSLFDLKVAVKRLRATLNCELCILASHRLQPDWQPLYEFRTRGRKSTMRGPNSTMRQPKLKSFALYFFH